MKNKFTKAFLSLAAMFVVLLAANAASAQNRRLRGVSKQQIEDSLKRIEERTDHFSNQLNKSLDRSRLDGSKTEDNIADRAKDLENATDELRREFDFNDPRGETRVNVHKVLKTGSAVNMIMIRRNFSRQAENSWINLRAELNSLARFYGLSPVGARSYR